MILVVMVPLILGGTVGQLFATDEVAFTFNTETSITKYEIWSMIEALCDAVEYEDSEMLRDLVDEFHPLILQNAYFEDGELTHLELDAGFDPDVLSETRHYCFGAGAEDVPMTAWEVLDGVFDLEGGVFEMEGRDVTYLNYPPHPDEMADLVGEFIFYPDTEYVELSHTFGIDASFKLWMVGDYYHGRYNGLEIYFCHSVESGEWFVRSYGDY